MKPLKSCLYITSTEIQTLDLCDIPVQHTKTIIELTNKLNGRCSLKNKLIQYSQGGFRGVIQLTEWDVLIISALRYRPG